MPFAKKAKQSQTLITSAVTDAAMPEKPPAPPAQAEEGKKQSKRKARRTRNNTSATLNAMRATQAERSDVKFIQEATGTKDVGFILGSLRQASSMNDVIHSILCPTPSGVSGGQNKKKKAHEEVKNNRARKTERRNNSKKEDIATIVELHVCEERNNDAKRNAKNKKNKIKNKKENQKKSRKEENKNANVLQSTNALNNRDSEIAQEQVNDATSCANVGSSAENEFDKVDDLPVDNATLEVTTIHRTKSSQEAEEHDMGRMQEEPEAMIAIDDTPSDNDAIVSPVTSDHSSSTPSIDIRAADESNDSDGSLSIVQRLAARIEQATAREVISAKVHTTKEEDEGKSGRVGRLVHRFEKMIAEEDEDDSAKWRQSRGNNELTHAVTTELKSTAVTNCEDETENKTSGEEQQLGKFSIASPISDEGEEDKVTNVVIPLLNLSLSSESTPVSTRDSHEDTASEELFEKEDVRVVREESTSTTETEKLQDSHSTKCISEASFSTTPTKLKDESLAVQSPASSDCTPHSSTAVIPDCIPTCPKDANQTRENETASFAPPLFDRSIADREQRAALRVILSSKTELTSASSIDCDGIELIEMASLPSTDSKTKHAPTITPNSNGKEDSDIELVAICGDEVVTPGQSAMTLTSNVSSDSVSEGTKDSQLSSAQKHKDSLLEKYILFSGAF